VKLMNPVKLMKLMKLMKAKHGVRKKSVRKKA